MARSAIVVGAGIIGLCIAFYLREEGWEVTVLERGSGEDGTSFGNAGLIVPSHFVPLASRGMLLSAARMMFKRTAPFGVKPFARGMGSWSRSGIKASLGPHPRRIAPYIRDLNLLSLAEYQQLLPAIGLPHLPNPRGVYMVAETDENWMHLREFARWANELDLATEEVSRTELTNRLKLACDTQGALYFPGDADFPPQQVMRALRKQIERLGVTILSGHEITGWDATHQRIHAVLVGETRFRADEFILAAGTWTSRLAQPLGLRLPLLPGKGHSMTLTGLPEPAAPVLLEQSKIAVNPMGSEGIRVSGNMVLGDWSHQPNRARISAVQERVGKIFPAWQEHDFRKEKVWVGHRPCTPDGLPLVGRTSHANLTVATGHAMMGMSLGAATGRIVADLLIGKTPPLPTSTLDPMRKMN